MVELNVFKQQGYRCRLAWGRRGAREAAYRGDILVVVDILRFSTAAVTAIHHGAYLYPCAENEDIQDLAARVEAVIGGPRANRDIRYSLSPLSYLDVEPGARIALASPNGATCSLYARDVPYLFVGALINAQAVGRHITQLLDTTSLAVTVLACGERWRTPSEDGELRFALEDYLGAGAILSYIPHTKSPEALACVGAFLHVQNDLESILLECGSGRELQEKGQTADVRHAAQLNLYDTVPIMRGERLERAVFRQD